MASRAIRPSTTKSVVALCVKSVLNAVLFFAIFMAALPAVAHWLMPGRVPIPSWLGAGVAGLLCAGGGAVWMYCLDIFSRRGRGTPFPLDAPRNLVTTGPYGVVRNPIMAGELAVIWGEAFFFSALGVFIYALLVTLAGHLGVVYIEEPELCERFGEEYETYCRRVPRWVPRMPGRRA